MHIQDILALPRTKQIAIVQAILAQWQAEEVSEQESLPDRQADAALQIAAEVEAGEMPVLSLQAWRAKVLDRRQGQEG